MKPKISVVVPVYNVEKYLRKCLDRLLTQTYKNIEVTLVNDGSTDNSKSICEEYLKKSDKIRLINKKNAGLGYARNTGLENCSGEYITFVDSDDYIDSNFIENLYNCMMEFNVDFCKSGYRRVMDSGKIISEKSYDTIIYDGCNAREHMVPLMLGSPPDRHNNIDVSVCGNLYKMRLIKENDIKFVSERELISEDLVFNIDYLQYSNGACTISYIGYNYRMNEISLTTSYREDRFEAIKHFYLEIRNKLISLGYQGEDLLRFDRSFFIYIRMCIAQENAVNINHGLAVSLTNIKKICKDPLVNDVIDSYPVNQLGFKQRLFLFFIKKRFSVILYVFSLLRKL